MLDKNILSIVTQLNTQTTPEQKIWISGYYAGLAGLYTGDNQSIGGADATALAPPSSPDIRVLVAYATQSGNAKKVAEQVAENFIAHNITPDVQNVSTLKVKALKDYTHIFMAVATYGDGDAPDTALAFHKDLHSKKAPDLSHTQFAVFALGDETYEKFCQTGIEVDAQLAQLGSHRICDIVLADTDFADHIHPWAAAITTELQRPIATVTTPTLATEKPAHTPFDKDTPYTATVLNIFNLHDAQSDKQTYHIELDLDDSGITYEVGDAVAVVAPNSTEQVEDLLHTTGFTGTETVTLKDESLSLRQALQKKCNITTPTASSLRYFLPDNTDAENKPFLQNYTFSHILQHHNIRPSAQDLVQGLPPLKPRLYSIASAMDAVAEELHITVGKTAWQDHADTTHLGQASGFLSNLQADDTVDIYIHKNDAFRLPKDIQTPIIMIGAGTGIAPFRAFMQQREHDGGGQNWLFFGEQTFQNDFLYQVEWQDYVAKKVLTHIDLAFSRDQAHKIYVQHILQQQALQVAQWIDNGACIYVCGSTHMAKEVHNTLIEIVQKHKNISLDDATDELNSYTAIGRYQRDIY